MYYVSFFQLTGHLWAIACPSSYISMGPDIGCKLGLSTPSRHETLIQCWFDVGPAS